MSEFNKTKQPCDHFNLQARSCFLYNILLLAHLHYCAFFREWCMLHENEELWMTLRHHYVSLKKKKKPSQTLPPPKPSKVLSCALYLSIFSKPLILKHHLCEPWIYSWDGNPTNGTFKQPKWMKWIKEVYCEVCKQNQYFSLHIYSTLHQNALSIYHRDSWQQESTDCWYKTNLAEEWGQSLSSTECADAGGWTSSVDPGGPWLPRAVSQPFLAIGRTL